MKVHFIILVVVFIFLVWSSPLKAQSEYSGTQSSYMGLNEKEVKDKFKEDGFKFDKETIEICSLPDKTCKVFIAQSSTEVIKCRFEESKGICNAVIRYKL